MLFLYNGVHVLEGDLLNVLNCFITVGESLYTKLLFYTSLENCVQLNQKLFIAVSGIFKPVAVIPDVEA